MIDEGKLPLLQQMYREWPFFSVTLDMVEMVFAKADPRVAQACPAHCSLIWQWAAASLSRWLSPMRWLCNTCAWVLQHTQEMISAYIFRVFHFDWGCAVLRDGPGGQEAVALRGGPAEALRAVPGGCQRNCGTTFLMLRLL